MLLFFTNKVCYHQLLLDCSSQQLAGLHYTKQYLLVIERWTVAPYMHNQSLSLLWVSNKKVNFHHWSFSSKQSDFRAMYSLKLTPTASKDKPPEVILVNLMLYIVHYIMAVVDKITTFNLLSF